MKLLYSSYIFHFYVELPLPNGQSKNKFITICPISEIWKQTREKKEKRIIHRWTEINQWFGYAYKIYHDSQDRNINDFNEMYIVTWFQWRTHKLKITFKEYILNLYLHNTSITRTAKTAM